MKWIYHYAHMLFFINIINKVSSHFVNSLEHVWCVWLCKLRMMPAGVFQVLAHPSQWQLQSDRATTNKSWADKASYCVHGVYYTHPSCHTCNVVMMVTVPGYFTSGSQKATPKVALQKGTSFTTEKCQKSEETYDDSKILDSSQRPAA